MNGDQKVQILCGKSLREKTLNDVRRVVSSFDFIRQLRSKVFEIDHDDQLSSKDKKSALDNLEKSAEVQDFLQDACFGDQSPSYFCDFVRQAPVLPHNPLLVTALVGQDAASQIYVNAKQKAAKSIGFLTRHYDLPQDISEKDLLEHIIKWNNDDEVHGILVQLPLPKHIREDKVVETISLLKDVDGFHPYNQGLLQKSFTRKMLAPCTPSGIMQMLEHYGVETVGKHAVVVGRSDIVGRPIATMLSQRSGKKKENVSLFEYFYRSEQKKSVENEYNRKMLHKNESFAGEKCGGDATVTLAHSRSKDLKKITLLGDLLIVAVGSPRFITADMVKKGAVVVDVGINRIDAVNDTIAGGGGVGANSNGCGGDGVDLKKRCLVGDVDFESVAKVASAITPVPGGVGLMTIAMLMRNTLIAYKNIANKIQGRGK